MGIVFLVEFLFGAAAFFVLKNLDKKRKVAVGLFFVIFGLLLGAVISINVGKEIAKKDLTSTSVTVLETVDLLSFSGSLGAYIVTGENQCGEKVAWYLQEEKLFEKPYNDIIDRNMIVFSNASTPSEQLVRVNAGSFWRWFAIIPIKNRFIIPAGGLQEGKIVKTYKYISVPE